MEVLKRMSAWFYYKGASFDWYFEIQQDAAADVMKVIHETKVNPHPMGKAYNSHTKTWVSIDPLIIARDMKELRLRAITIHSITAKMSDAMKE